MCGKRIARFALLAALAPALLVGGCRRGETGSNPVSRVADLVKGTLKRGPVLRVEAREFTNDDLLDYVRSTGVKDPQKLSADSLSRLFDRFVDEKILLEAARRRNMSLTWEEKKAYLAKVAAEADPDKPAPPADPAAPDSVFDGLLIEKYDSQVVKDVKAEEAEVRAYYDEHKKDFLLPERVQVSQILVATEQRAVAVLRRVGDAPEAEFRKAAREESSGPEAFKGGVMGVYRQGDLPSDMEKVIFAMDVGTVSRVVESSYGYHIFRLDARFSPQLQPLEEAAPAVRVRVLERKIGEALAAHLAGLKETLSWQASPDNLFFAYQRITP